MQPITYRKGLPAFNVKVYRSPSAEECREVAAELGIDPAALARPPAEPRKRPAPLLPFGPDWIEAYAERDPEGYAYLMGETASDRFEHAREQARELFGPRAEVFQEGRSGGWLVLQCPGLDRDTIEAAEAVVADAARAESQDELRDAHELVENLSRFADYLRSTVADHPRAQAWALAQVFQHCAEEQAEKQAEKRAAERLSLARTAFEDAATRLRDAALPALWASADPSIEAEELRKAALACAEALDAARLELEQAKGGAS